MLALGGAAAVSVTRMPVTGGEPSAACVVLLDATASTTDSQDLQRRAVLAAVEGCARRDAVLTLGRVDAAGVAFVGDGGFPLHPPAGRSAAKQRTRQAQQLEVARQAATALVAQPSSADAGAGTDLLTAIGAAADVLRIAAPDVERHLVLVTDGIQHTSDLSVEALSEGDAGEVAVAELVDRVASAGLVPDLDGAAVSMVGVRRGQVDGRHLPAWFEGQLQRFWTEVVTRSGGRLCLYAPDAQALPVDCP